MKKLTVDDVYNFISDCNEADRITYEPYIDEETIEFYEEKTMSPILCTNNFKLLKDNTGTLLALRANDNLLGLCSVFEYAGEAGLICEISLLVSPDYRRHRIGSALLKAMISSIEKTHSNATILLVGSTQPFAEYNGFAFSHSEHFMCKEIPADYKLTDNALPDNMQLTHKGVNLKDVAYRLYVDEISVARCHVYDAGSYLNLSHVYTNKKHRGMGYAGILINAISSIYPDKKLLLQVSGSNTSAIKAYTKIGFAFINTTDYYILED